MITFIISVVLVFIAVDLFVRLIVEPMILRKSKKVSKSSTSKLDPTFKLATETMYDGGKLHSAELSNNAVYDENNSKDEVKS
jgi:hypothetical protein